MRVALISYEFPAETIGGIGSYAGHAARMLARRGHDVTVYAGTGSASARDERFEDVLVWRLPCRARQSFHTVAVPQLAEDHHARAFDVAEVPDLYAEGFGLRAAAPDLPIVLRAHTPSFIAHEIDFHALPAFARRASALRRIAGGIARAEPWSDVRRTAHARVHFDAAFDLERDPERQVALDADLIAPPSARLADRLQAEWRIPPGKLRVVPYPHIPSDRLLSLRPPSEAVTIAFHGGVRYFKGVHVLVEAMRRVLSRHPGVRLVLAGASAASPVVKLSPIAWWKDRMVEWQDTIQWLRPRLAQLGERVVIRGFVPPQELPDHLAAADICVFPSLFDNFPNACLEAMSAARPIVATRSGGMEEMLGNDGGLLVPPGDAAALAAALCRLIEEPPLRMRLASRARERLLERYSLQAVGPLQERLYEQAAACRRSQGGAS